MSREQTLSEVVESCEEKLSELRNTLESTEGIEFPNAVGKANEIETKIDELVGEIETALEE